MLELNLRKELAQPYFFYFALEFSKKKAII